MQALDYHDRPSLGDAAATAAAKRPSIVAGRVARPHDPQHHVSGVSAAHCSGVSRSAISAWTNAC
jgi:hypothetical protein